MKEEHIAKMSDMAARIEAMKPFKGKAAMRNNILAKIRHLRRFKGSGDCTASLFVAEAEKIYDGALAVGEVKK